MFTVGQRVSHWRLGEGVIRKIGEQYGAPAALVQWDTYGRSFDDPDYWEGKTRPRTWVRLASLTDPAAPADPNSFRAIAGRIATGPEDEDFIHAILSEPGGDPYWALVSRYGGWLRAQGDVRGEYIALWEKTWTGGEGDEFAESFRRRGELRTQISQLWRGLILRASITGVVTGMDDHAFYADFDGLEGEGSIADMSS